MDFHKQDLEMKYKLANVAVASIIMMRVIRAKFDWLTDANNIHLFCKYT